MAAKTGNKNAVGNKGGRPSKYMPYFAKQALKLCLLGATDRELADFFEVNEYTINAWKKKHIEFHKSLKKGKIMADAEVAAKLFDKAVGYSHADTDIKIHAGKIIKTKIIKHCCQLLFGFVA